MAASLQVTVRWTRDKGVRAAQARPCSKSDINSLLHADWLKVNLPSTLASSSAASEGMHPYSSNETVDEAGSPVFIPDSTMRGGDWGMVREKSWVLFAAFIPRFIKDPRKDPATDVRPTHKKRMNVKGNILIFPEEDDPNGTFLSPVECLLLKTSRVLAGSRTIERSKLLLI
eukprot:CAMPEP_0184480138 /NCGR_PEP_ID=MMETSP0113_2-20130426/1628_1 /TAXON_ID=91329 /ORGANISM="Norrisiella sphaerica, Strain BC52" /LENGTH=171 /DNA_ID=CAMNT_0026858411 /DNA_START=608 /DNA_END=1123 /DNA_ORIENTATION=+